MEKREKKEGREKIWESPPSSLFLVHHRWDHEYPFPSSFSCSIHLPLSFLLYRTPYTPLPFRRKNFFASAVLEWMLITFHFFTLVFSKPFLQYRHSKCDNKNNMGNFPFLFSPQGGLVFHPPPVFFLVERGFSSPPLSLLLLLSSIRYPPHPTSSFQSGSFPQSMQKRSIRTQRSSRFYIFSLSTKRLLIYWQLRSYFSVNKRKWGSKSGGGGIGGIWFMRRERSSYREGKRGKRKSSRSERFDGLDGKKFANTMQKKILHCVWN